MSWISKILGKEEAAGVGAPEAAPEAAPAAEADAAPEAAAGEATETVQDPVQDPLVAAGAASDHAGIVASLRAHLTAVAEKHDQPLRPDELRDDADLFEAGYLDSLMASEFLVLAEKQFGVPLPDWLIGGKANTLETLARYIADEMPSS